MPYKISGTINDSARIIIIKEDDWSVESNTEESPSSFEVVTIASGSKLIVGVRSDGETLSFGNVTPSLYGETGIFAGAYVVGPTMYNIMDYITISTTGNAQDFGDLTEARSYPAAASNGNNNRGTFAAGSLNSGTTNTIDYVTISISSNASDFGDLPENNSGAMGTSNNTNDRGISAGGYTTTYVNTINYITISSLGNAQDFGDMVEYGSFMGTTSNGINNRGIFGGGYLEYENENLIQYITISRGAIEMYSAQAGFS